MPKPDFACSRGGGFVRLRRPDNLCFVIASQRYCLIKATNLGLKHSARFPKKGNGDSETTSMRTDMYIEHVWVQFIQEKELKMGSKEGTCEARKLRFLLSFENAFELFERIFPLSRASGFGYVPCIEGVA